MSSHECDYCLKKFSRADSRKRHEKTCKVKEYLNPIGEQTEPTSPLLGPISPTEPTSPVETVEPPSPTETTESVEPKDLESPKVHIDPKTGRKFMFDAFGDPMSPDSLKPLDVFHEAHTTPMEDEV